MKKMMNLRKTHTVRIILAMLTVAAIACGICACGKKPLPKELKTVIEDLYANQKNFSEGTAMLNIIPSVTVEAIYNNWEDVSASGMKEAPISLREYVEPSIVYLDYATDFSIKWVKDTGEVSIEATDVQAREDYKQKAHR